MLEPAVSRSTPSAWVAHGKGTLSRLATTERRSVQLAQVAAVLVAGLLIRLAFIQSPGYHDDVVIFAGWYRSISHLPLSAVYGNTPGLNYPPMCVLMYKLEAVFAGWFIAGPPDDAAINVIIKLPPIIVDLLGATLAYQIVRRWATHAAALTTAAFIAFNPAIIYDSAYWGQNDSIPTVLALFAVMQVLAGRPIVAWIAITCAVLFKPPVLVIVPLLLLYPATVTGAQRRRWMWGTGIGIALSVILVQIIAVTFFDHSTLVAAPLHLAGKFISFSHVFPYNSLNAFNVWALFGPFFVSDSQRFFGIPMRVWSEVLYLCIAAVILWRYVRSRDPVKLLEASTLLLLAFFVVLTEMHERYLYYAVFFCAVLLFRRPYATAALVLTMTLVLNLEYGLTFMVLDDAKTTLVDRFEFAPWLVHLCAVANVTVLGWLLLRYVRREPVVYAEALGS